MAESPTRARDGSGVARLLLGGPGGVVRVVGVVALVVALTRGPVDAALSALVLGGLTAPLLGDVGPRLDAAYGVGVLAAAWAGLLDLYEAVTYLDLVMHLVVTGLVAAVTHLVFARRTGTVAEPAAARGAPGWVGSVAVTTALGLALSVLWEVGEYLGHTYADPDIFVTYRDTIGDMVMGGLGSAVAGVLLVASARGARREPGVGSRA